MKKFRILALILSLLVILSAFSFSVSAAPDARTKLALIIGKAEQSASIPGGNLTGASVSAVHDAIDEACEVYYDVTATDAELNEQAKKVYTAMYNLESYDCYSTALWMAKNYAESLDPADFTDESYKVLEDALKIDAGILYYPNSQEDLDAATDAINNAIAQLVPVGDATAPVETPKDKLIRVKNRAMYCLYEREVIYTTASEEELAAAYEQGTLLIDTANATDDMFNNAAQRIQNAIDGLVELNWDTSDLDEAIITAYLMDYENDYSEASYQRFRNALYKANDTLWHAQSQKEVDDAAEELYIAIYALEYISGGKYDETQYSRFINLMHKGRTHLELDGAKYTPESIENLSSLIDEYEYIEFDYYYEDDYYETPANNLETAIFALEFAESTPATTTVSETSSTTSVATELTSTVYETTETDVISTEPSTATFDEPEETTSATITTEPQESTTSAKETVTTPNTTHSFGISFIVGDVDDNSKITIKDATAIQKYSAKLIDLSYTACLAGDTTEDGKLNIKDATEIQKFLANLPCNLNIGNLIEINYTPEETEPTTEFAEDIIETTATMATADEIPDEPAIPTTTAMPDSVSTDPTESTSYETVTTDTTEATVATETTIVSTETIAETETATEHTESTTVMVDDIVTVYFTNTQQWENVYIHYWNDHISTVFPGFPMEFVETNDYGQDVYKFDISENMKGLVFSAGKNGPQTVDILSFDDNMGFYPVKQGTQHWEVETYEYISNENTPVDISFSELGITYIFEGYNGQNLLCLIKDRSDLENDSYLENSLSHIDIDALSSRQKALVVSLSSLGSGNCTQRVDQMTVKGNELIVFRVITVHALSATDMNYQLLVFEVNLEDVKNVTELTDHISTIYKDN